MAVTCPSTQGWEKGSWRQMNLKEVEGKEKEFCCPSSLLLLKQKSLCGFSVNWDLGHLEEAANCKLKLVQQEQAPRRKVKTVGKVSSMGRVQIQHALPYAESFFVGYAVHWVPGNSFSWANKMGQSLHSTHPHPTPLWSIFGMVSMFPGVQTLDVW